MSTIYFLPKDIQLHIVTLLRCEDIIRLYYTSKCACLMKEVVKSLAQLYGVKDNVETFEDLAYHFWCFNPLSFFKKSLQNDRFDRADIARFNIGNFRVTVLLGYGDTKMSMAAATYLYIYGNPGDDVSATTKMILNEVIIKDGTLSGFKEFISKYNIDIRDDVNVRRSVTCGVKE